MRFLSVLALSGLFLFLGACSTTATTTPAAALSALQTNVTKACTVVQPFLLSMVAMDSDLSLDVQADLNKASSDAALVCSKAATVTAAVASDASGTVAVTPATLSLTDVATFVNEGVPKLLTVIASSSLNDKQKSAAEIAITAAQLAVTTSLAAAQ